MIDIVFKENNINTLSANGGVFIGQNALYGWSGHAKQNNAVEASRENFGNHSGSVNILIDRDVIDSPIFTADRIVTANNFVKGSGRPVKNKKTSWADRRKTSGGIEINGMAFSPDNS